MKIKSINGAAGIAGATAAGLVLLAALIVSSGQNLPMWIALAAASFAIPFCVARWVIRKFLIYKIKPLYQIVFSRNMHSEELTGHLSGRNMVGRMESELSQWAARSDEEITRLKDNEKYRKEFLGNVSHEMKTPLFTLQGYVSTLLDGAMDDPAINMRYLERSEKAVDRLISIVTDLEEISKLEAGNLTLNIERFDVAELAREIAEDASLEAQRRQVTVTIGNGEILHHPVWVAADRKYIGQVITNLVINSIKYGREGGSTKVSFVDMFDHIMVEVSDNGTGISQQDIPRVFERFFRADKSRSREMGGTGLGLSIVKHIIEAHDQRITLRSQPDKGSTFSFTLDKA